MTIYFSPSTRGFFDTAIHGPRQIEVVDEAAASHARIVAIGLDKAAFDDAVTAAERDGQPAPFAEEFTRNLAAALASPPMKTVDNPACALPADAIAISAEVHAGLMKAQAEGKAIDVGPTGMPIAVAREADQVAAVRAARDAALKKSDWTQLADAGLSAATKKAWTAHRKRLRDLPALVAAAIAEGRDPAEIEFPEAPA